MKKIPMIPLPGVRLATSMWSTATRSGWLLILSLKSWSIIRMKIAIMKAIIKIIKKWSNSTQSSPDWISQWVARIVTLSPRWVVFRVRGTFLNRSLDWNVLPDKIKWFNFVATIRWWLHDPLSERSLHKHCGRPEAQRGHDQDWQDL